MFAEPQTASAPRFDVQRRLTAGAGDPLSRDNALVGFGVRRRPISARLDARTKNAVGNCNSELALTGTRIAQAAAAMSLLLDALDLDPDCAEAGVFVANVCLRLRESRRGNPFRKTYFETWLVSARYLLHGKEAEAAVRRRSEKG